ncbi:MAG: leucine-rich repeat domain-containing protein [Bacteroidia bacterium]|nr:leucine-rich repeat domain-containing protein [Bacteroidia bacterium]
MKFWFSKFLLLFTLGCYLSLSAQTNLDSQPWFYDLDEALKSPEKVYKLSLSDKKYTEFPKEILVFKNLQVLNLNRNKIKELPADISTLKNLRELSLYKNKLVHLPKEFCELTRLESCYLGKNQLEGFPREIVNLRKLRYLDLTNNNLTLYEISYIRKALPNCQIDLLGTPNEKK